MNRIRQIVDGTDTRVGRAFDLGIQGLIILSLASFSLETLPSLDGAWKRLLRSIEVATVAMFTLEYALRLLVSRHRLRFVFSFFGLVDLLAILPFYLATGVDLRAVRALRLLRLARILKLVRFNHALERLSAAFVSIRSELVVFLTATALLLYVSAVGIYYFEQEAQPEHFKSVFHSLWWATTTLTTVGYGDVYPVTLGGRLFTFVVLMIGLGVVAVPAGLFASAMSAIVSAKSTGQTDRDD